MRDSAVSFARRGALLALVVAVAACVRFYRLGSENFWVDEIYTVEVASQPLGDIVRNYTPDGGPSRRDQAPLSFMLTHLFLSSQHPERAARLPSAIFGTAEVVVVFLVARELFPAPIPLIAAGLLAISPLHVRYSQEVRWYAQWTFLMSLSYLALVRAAKTERWRPVLAYAAATALAAYTFIFTFFVVAAQALSVLSNYWMGLQSGRFVRRFIGVQIAVVLSSLPVLLWMLLTNFGLGTGDSRLTRLSAVPYTAFAYAVGFSLGPPLDYLHRLGAVRHVLIDYPIVIVVFALFAPITVLGFIRLCRQPAAAALVLPWLLVLPLLAFSFGLLPNATYNVRYTLAALPAFALLLALGICALGPRPLQWAAGAAVVGCALASLANYYWNPQYQREDVRGALAHIRAAGRPGDPVVIMGQAEGPVRYYGRDLAVLPLQRCEPNRLKTTGAPVFWMIISRDWDGEARRCMHALAQDYPATERRRFAGVDLWQFGESATALRSSSQNIRVAPEGDG